jgi:nucleoid DNA-binding protein
MIASSSGKSVLDVTHVPRALRDLIECVVRPEDVDKWLVNSKSFPNEGTPLELLSLPYTIDNGKSLRSNIHRIAERFYQAVAMCSAPGVLPLDVLVKTVADELREASSNLPKSDRNRNTKIKNYITTTTGKRATRTEVFAALAAETGLSKKQVSKVLDGLSEFIKVQVGKEGPGVFVLPGLLKIKRHRKPKQSARIVRNPKTGESMQIPAKPARTVVKVLALKNLKDVAK